MINSSSFLYPNKIYRALHILYSNICKMPVFIQNEHEVTQHEDDTGSYDNSHVVECGTRVLELIEKHKKEVQSRMASNEYGFKVMLEKNRKNEYQDRGAAREKERPGVSRRSKGSSSDNSKIVQLYNDYLKSDTKQKNTNYQAVKTPVGTAGGSAKNQISESAPTTATSDEYLELPRSMDTTADPPAVAANSVATSYRVKKSNFCNDLLRQSPPNMQLNHRGTTPNEDDFLYEPDEENHPTEESFHKDDGDEGKSVNNNKSVPKFVTQVKFQFPNPNVKPLPKVRDLGTNEQIDKEANPLKSSSSRAKSTRSKYSKSNLPNKSSKHVKSKTHQQSNELENEGADPHLEDDDDRSSDEHDVTNNSSFYSNTTESISPDGGFLEQNFWILILILIVGLIIFVVVVGYLILHSNLLGNGEDGAAYNKNNNNYFNGPVM